MSKSNDKKINQKNNTVLNAVAKTFGVSSRYVRMCLNKERVGINADNIIKAYNKAVLKIEQAEKRILESVKKPTQ